VPYNGPLAPPTVEISVIATPFSTAAISASHHPSSLAATARKPRAMFSPWSLSPIGASSSVRYAFCASNTDAARSSQARINARSMLSIVACSSSPA